MAATTVGFEITDATWQRLDEACRFVLQRRGMRPAEIAAILERLRRRRQRMNLHFHIGTACPPEAAQHVDEAVRRLQRGVENLTLAFVGELLDLEAALLRAQRPINAHGTPRS